MAPLGTEWWAAPESLEPRHIMWWAVEHVGHAAFYLRALMPGDFGPHGSGPLPRHTYYLNGQQAEEYPTRCSTCQLIPAPGALVPIERYTGDRGRELFFKDYVFGLKPWPGPTQAQWCWLCSDPSLIANQVFHVEGKDRRVCQNCRHHLEKFAGRIR